MPAMKKAKGVKPGQAKYGMGLFATKKFRKDDEVGEITGERFHDPDYSSEYCIDLGDDMALEPESRFGFSTTAASRTANCTSSLMKTRLPLVTGKASSKRWSTSPKAPN